MEGGASPEIQIETAETLLAKYEAENRPYSLASSIEEKAYAIRDRLKMESKEVSEDMEKRISAAREKAYRNSAPEALSRFEDTTAIADAGSFRIWAAEVGFMHEAGKIPLTEELQGRIEKARKDACVRSADQQMTFWENTGFLPRDYSTDRVTGNFQSIKQLHQEGAVPASPSLDNRLNAARERALTLRLPGGEISRPMPPIKR
jgi:hypothetical protein